MIDHPFTETSAVVLEFAKNRSSATQRGYNDLGYGVGGHDANNFDNEQKIVPTVVTGSAPAGEPYRRTGAYSNVPGHQLVGEELENLRKAAASAPRMGG